MRLGDHLQTEIYADWRFVEDDLYGIAERVKEYDGEARLVRQDESGHLGLARLMPGDFMPGCAGTWLVARRLSDPETGEPLTGEPDQRVLTEQRSSDFFRVQDPVRWRKRMHGAWMLELQRRRERFAKANEEYADRMVHRMSRDSGGWQSHIYVPSRKAG